MLMVASSAWGNWSVDNSLSKVSFVSVKNDQIGEVHHFSEINGSLSEKGKLRVEIPLDTVQTMIPIRDQRMRKLLFDTVQFPTALISAQLTEQQLDLTLGESKIITVTAQLGLKGVTAPLNIEVMLTKVTKQTLQAFSVKPIIINPVDFGLDKGIKQLQAVASLANITQSVPVNFILTLKE